MTLFDSIGFIASERHPHLEPKMSADQRRTARNKAMLDRGTHPATLMPVLTEWGYTCRDCTYSFRVDHNGRQWWKCKRHRLGPSRSAASDIRVGWPACTLLKIDGRS